MKVSASYKRISSPIDAMDALALRAVVRVSNISFRASSLQHAIRTVWGIVVPEMVCQYSLSRLAKDGHLKLEENKRSGIYEYKTTISTEIRARMLQRENEARDIILRTAGKIDRYLQAETPGTDRKGSDILEQWLDTSSLALLAESNRPGSVTSEDIQVNNVIARMMGVLAVVDDSFLEDLSLLALGDAIYRSVKSLTEMEVEVGPRIEEGFNTAEMVEEGLLPMARVDVYLDTSIMLRILGYFGSLNGKAAAEFLEVCQATGCRMCMFEHTFDECVEGILAVAGRLQGRSATAYGPLVGFALENGLDASDLIGAAARLRQEIASNGIDIKFHPPHSEELGLDERMLEKAIETEVKQSSHVARLRDLDSLASTFRLREGRGKDYLENCSSVFVTHNRTLANCGTRFFRSHFAQQNIRNSVQICMTDVVFATRLWVKLPTTSIRLPKMQILQHAIGNLVPSEKVVDRFKSILASLIQRNYLREEDALRIEYTEFARMALAMDVRDENDLTTELAGSIILNAIDEIKNKIEAAADKKFDKHLEEAKQDISSLSNKVQEVRPALSDAEIKSAEMKIRFLQEELETTSANLRMVNALANFSASAITAAIIIVFSCGVLFLALRDIGIENVAGYRLDSRLLTAIRFVAGLIGAALAIFGLDYYGLFAPCRDKMKLLLLRAVLPRQ